MPPRKQQKTATQKHKYNTDDLPTKTIKLKPLNWYAYEPDDPHLAGRTYLGRTFEDAFKNARADATRFYKGEANVEFVVEE